MSDPIAQQTADRALTVIENWPTLSESFGCVECEYIFRRAVKGGCPLCGSKSVFRGALRPNPETQEAINEKEGTTEV